MQESITVYSIELTKGQYGSEFETFMLNEIFPAVPKVPTLAGQVTRLILLKGNTAGRSHEYLWLVYGKDLMNGGAARGQISKIEAFGAKVSPIQDFVERVRWLAEVPIPNLSLTQKN